MYATRWNQLENNLQETIRFAEEVSEEQWKMWVVVIMSKKPPKTISFAVFENTEEMGVFCRNYDSKDYNKTYIECDRFDGILNNILVH